MDEKYGLLKKGLIVLAIPFVIQLAFLGVLLKSQIDNAKAQTLAIHTKDVIAEVESLLRRLVTLRSNLLGLVITGDAAANPYESVAREVPEQLEPSTSSSATTRASRRGSTPSGSRSATTSPGRTRSTR